MHVHFAFSSLQISFMQTLMSVHLMNDVMSMLIVPTLLEASPVSVTMVTLEMEYCVQVWVKYIALLQYYLVNKVYESKVACASSFIH